MKLNKLLIIAIILLVTIVGVLYVNNNSTFFKANGLDAIPENASFIIQLRSGHQSLDSLRSTDFWKSFCANSSIAAADKKFSLVDSVLLITRETKAMWTEAEAFISVHPTKARDFDLLLVLKQHNAIDQKKIIEWANSWQSNGLRTETREYENTKIIELWKKNVVKVAVAISDGLVLVSSTSFLVENSIHHLKSEKSIRESKSFKRLSIPSKDDNGINLFVNQISLQKHLEAYLNISYSSLLNAIGSFSRWQGFNINFKANQIQLEGTASSLDTSDLVLCFRNQATEMSKIHHIIPRRTSFCLRFGSDNLIQTFQQMRSNNLFFDPAENSTKEGSTGGDKSGYEPKILSWIGNEIALFITETGNTSPDNNSFAIIQCNNSNSALNSLNELQKKYNGKEIRQKYLGYNLGKINSENLLALNYGKQFRMIRNPWYFQYKDYIIFANQQSAIKGIIDDIENETSLSTVMTESEKSNFEKASNIGLYIDFAGSLNLLYAITNEKTGNSIAKKLEIWDSFGTFQYNSGNSHDKVIVQAQLNFNKTKTKEVSLIWSADLDNEILLHPSIVDAGKGKYAVICQDKGHNLYYFDQAGNLVWKKELDEPILSRIYDVDYYKNGESQIFFSTATKLFLINSGGSNVARYPIKLPARASNGASVIETNGRNNFVIYIACENEQIYAYELNGKPVPDWQTNLNLKNVKLPVEPIRVNQKRNLLIQSQDAIYLSDIRGKMKLLNSTSTLLTNSTLRILPDSSGSSIICYRDSNETTTMLLDNQVIKKFSAPPQSINYCISRSHEKSKLYEGILYKDSLIFRSLDDKKTCLKYLSKLEDYTWVHSTDKYSNSWTGLSSDTKNRFLLINEDCSITKGFPVNGSGEFSIRNSENPNNLILSIGSENSTIYLYHIE